MNTAPIRKKDGSLLSALAIIIVVAIVLALVGFLFLTPPAEVVEGQAEATSVRISGKLPGRVMEFYVHEGQQVKAGDTLVHIHSSLAEAKLLQAEAMANVAAAQNQKAERGTRSQIVQGAYDLWQQAIAARNITKKTYDRMSALYDKNVVSAQKRDEAQAAYEAAQAGERAAKSQYDLAVEGAQREDKASARSMVDAAKGSVKEVEALLEDQYLIAPCDGEIDEIYPNEGELIALGAPVMNLLKLQDKWLTFNVREEMLKDLPMGQEITVSIPALDNRKIKAKVYYVGDMGEYAVWHATKATGTYDSRSFKIKARPSEDVPDLRPGMSIIYDIPEK